MELGRLGRRKIEANFEGGTFSSDSGLMPIREVDRRLGLSKAVAKVLYDPRDQDAITHSLRDLIAQGLYGLVRGYEDLLFGTRTSGHRECSHIYIYQLS
ncbi:MAG: transposase [Candidatus Accumulibacter sp.]|jgi:hypothetical protein|nr:transposase [Accumulibacter sp.]